jgi:pimeloyl-ACP methyl ester carboxylesterase
VVAPDQRGYSPGARPEGVEHYAIDLLAEDVLGLADALGWDTFHLIGHDWGAAVAWYTAAHHAGRLRTLTTLSVPHLAAYNRALRDDPDQQERAAYIGFLRIEGKAERLLLEDDARRLREMYAGIVPADQADTYIARLSEPGALTGALSWYRAMTSALGDLPDVLVPTTLIWGNDDLAIGRAPVEECAQHVAADYALVELDASHWLPEQEPDAVVDAVLARVRSVQA